MSGKPRIKLPESARAGEVIEIRTLFSHVMETGNRRDNNGELVPRNIVHTFIARFEEVEIIKLDVGAGTSANPHFVFHMKVPGPGSFEFIWIDDRGNRIAEKLPLNVVP
jgi:sulfur-oxidizing protein SoxZ